MGHTRIPSFIIAGTSSGSGKTTIALGLMAAFKARGLRVQPYKCGPDFIDPGLHELITGTVSRNLDLWMSGEEFTYRCFHGGLQDADVAIVEGVMGMFDGGQSSSASLASYLNVDTILVLDVRSTAESAAAMLKGFETLEPLAAPKGVILNRIGSERHLQLVSDAIKKHCSSEILGYIPRTLEFAIPSRHLGLLTGDEAPLSPKAIQTLTETVTKHINLDRILELCTIESVSPPDTTSPKEQPICKIAVARDRAFCFYYEDNLDLLRAEGAEIEFFSPLTDSSLPENTGAVYLGGGYPELYAKELSANRAMIKALRKWVEDDGQVYAECGGFMYLTEGIVDTTDTFYPMAAVFPVHARMQKSRTSLGYRQVTTRGHSFFGPAGTILRGHEFHYSSIDTMPDHVKRVYQVNNGTLEGYCHKNVLGGYMHLHFGYNPQAVKNFINHCQH